MRTIKNRLKYTGLLVVGSLLLTACGADDSGDSKKPTTDTGSVNTSQGKALYDASCANSSCHGDSGEGLNNLKALCSDVCDNLDALIVKINDTMPPGATGDCVGDCATKTAEYIYYTFNGHAAPQTGGSVEGIALMSPKQTVRNASLALSGRSLTQSEAEQLANASDAELATWVNQLVESDAFYERLNTMYNDLLLTDKYLGGSNALNLLNSADFPSRYWYHDSADYDNYSAEYNANRTKSNTAVAREPMMLIEYVVRNNLPFTEILTADYMVMNPWSARSYGMLDELNFNDDYSETELKKAQLTLKSDTNADISYPHAGILTSPMFLRRYPTTATNLNRHRARIVYQYFLDVDILAMDDAGEISSTDIASGLQEPTLQDGKCKACHELVDPIASSFRNWDNNGNYRPPANWPTQMLSPGFAGEVMPEVNTLFSLQWLVPRVASDTRFATATVKTLYTGLTGRKPLAKNEAGAIEQGLWFNRLAQQFKDANYNYKSLVRFMVLSPEWRAAAITENGVQDAHLGLDHLLTPEQLDSKITALLGITWKSGSTQRLLHDNHFRSLYGGINSDDVNTRITSTNGMMALVQERMANEVACYSVSRDFFRDRNERVLFPNVSSRTSPVDYDNMPVASNVSAIKQNIAFLYWHLLGEEHSVTSDAVNDLYTLFDEVRLLGVAAMTLAEDHVDYESSYLVYNCQLRYHPDSGEYLPSAEQISRDDEYLLRAWTAVIATMLNDYKFLYQ